MATLEAIVGSTTYNLTDDLVVLWVGEDGVGMADVRRISESSPQQHGDTDIDYRLEPRLFREAFLINPDSLSAHYDRRKSVLRIFRPSLNPIKLRWTLDNGDVRQIDCHYSGGAKFASSDRKGFTQKLVAEFRAADPVFYHPNAISVVYNVGSGSGGFIYPLVFPVSFGGSTVNQTTTIEYDGTFREYPIITIVGPVTDPVVTNQATSDKLDFTGITISAGDYYTIDLRYGYKTVVNAAGTNKIADLTNDSDLTTFSLEADPDVADGLNPIKVTGSAANSVTSITLTYYNRYVGI